MALYLKRNGAAIQWLGEPIGDVTYPLNIEGLPLSWSDSDLAALGLFRATPAPSIPAGQRFVSSSIELLGDEVTEVIVTEAIPAPAAPSTDPADYDLTDWQLRLGLITNGKFPSDIEAMIKGIPDRVQRETLWTYWDRFTVIQWANPTAQALITFVGLTDAQARPMWMAAKDYRA